MVLELGREIDTVVLTNVTDCLRGQLLGLGRDSHGIKDMPTGSEIATEGSWRDIGQSGQRAFADETVFVVEVYHVSGVKEVKRRGNRPDRSWPASVQKWRGLRGDVRHGWGI